MLTVVKHKKTGNEYVLIGTGLGAYKATRPSAFLGNLAPHEEEGQIKAAAVCDRDGNILWFPTEELKVVAIGGTKVEDIF